jgi:hypothetical protein
MKTCRSLRKIKEQEFIPTDDIDKILMTLLKNMYKQKHL